MIDANRAPKTFFRFSLLLLFSLAALSVSCSLFTKFSDSGVREERAPDSVAGVSSGYATVSLKAKLPVLRTVNAPSLSLTDFSDVSLAYTPVTGSSGTAGSISAETFSALNTSLSTTLFELGEYTFVLSASLNGAAYSGEITHTLVAGANTLSIALEAAPGYGGFSVTISLTDTSDVTSVKAHLEAIDETSVISEEELWTAAAQSAGSVTWAKTAAAMESAAVAAGQYRIVIVFYGGADGDILLNTYKEIVRIIPGAQSSATHTLDPNNVYTITWNNAGGSLSSAEDTQPAAYSIKSGTITLPVLTKSGYLFLGWYTDSAFATSAGTALAAGSTGDKTFYARFIQTTLYVSSSGNDSNDGLSETASLATLSAALDKINAIAEETDSETGNWLVYVSGSFNNTTVTVGTLKATSLTIQANPDSTSDVLSGSSSDPVLALENTIPVTIKNLTIQNGLCGITASGTGSVTVTGAAITNCSGSGISVTGTGEVTVESESLIDGNRAENGGGIYAAIGTTVIVKDSTITGNTATSAGGGIYSEGSLTLDAATIGNKNATEVASSGSYGNKAETQGGGIYASGTMLIKGDSWVTYNYVSGASNGNGGGGVLLNGGELTIEDDAKISCNSASGLGGGIGVLNSGATVSMTGGSISGNAAGDTGGGVHNEGTFCMSGNAVIGDITQTTTATATSGEHSNMATSHGGGVYNTGNIYIGYTDADTADESFTGGIGYNYSNYQGGAIYSAGTSSAVLKMSGGSLCYNAAKSDGGAVRLGGAGDSFTMTGGSVTGNIANVTTGNGGGGFYLGGGTTLAFSGNASVTHNTAWAGGGVYANNAAVTMLGSASVSYNTATLNIGFGGGIYQNVADGSTGSFVLGGAATVSHNTAPNGAGLAVTGGSVYIGYSAAGTSDTSATCAISSNTASDSGGGIYADTRASSLFMAAGTVSSNTAQGWGGGLMLGGSSVLTMTGGSITTNSTEMDGGGVYIDTNAELNMSGGSLSQNHAENHGSGVCPEGDFRMSGGAVVTGDNDVYVQTGYYILVGGSLTGTAPVATITPAAYTAGTTVLREEENEDGSVNGYVVAGSSKFAVTAQSDGTNVINWSVGSDGALQRPYGISFTLPSYSSDDLELACTQSGTNCTFSAKSGYSTYIWTVNGNTTVTTTNTHTVASSGLVVGSNELLLVAVDASGNYHEAHTTVTVSAGGENGVTYFGSKLPFAARAVGDIVYSDGSATPYSADLPLTDEQLSHAVAVIFYTGTGLNSDDADGNADTSTRRTLGVGIVHNTGRIAWCSDSATAYNISVTTILCPYSGSRANYSFTGDKNGSDNLEQMSAFEGVTDTATESLYPAFYFAKNYASKTGTHVSGTAYETGWYLPSAAELYECYKNRTVVDAAITLCGGNPFGTSSYWTSSPASDYTANASDFSFGNEMYYSVQKSNGYQVRACAIREF